MSRTYHHGRNRDRERQIKVRGIRRDPPDLRGIARVLIALAQAQAEAEAKAEAPRPLPKDGRPKKARVTRRQDNKQLRGDAA